MRPRRSPAATALSSVVALQVGVSLPVFMAATLAPYLKLDIGLTERSLGVTIALFHAVSSLSSVSLGRLADRQTWQRGTQLAAASTLVPLLLIAGVVQSMPVLAILLASTALGHSLAVSTGNLAVFQEVPRPRQGLSFGVKQAAVPAAMMLAGLSAPLVAETWGWRPAFLLILVFPLSAALLSRTARATAPVRARRREGRQGTHMSREERHRLRILAAAIGLASFTASSTGAFFVLFAVHRGLSPSAAGVVVAVCSLANIVMRVLLGWLADRRGADGIAWVSVLLLGGAVGYFVLTVADSQAVVAFGAVLAYGMGWAWQGLVHLGAVRLAPDEPGYSSGVIRTGMSAGAGTGPVVSGLTIAYLGYGGLWTMQACLSCIAALAIFVTIRRMTRHDRTVEVASATEDVEND
jgi:predicted MFS family arabinose efflux permease